MAAISRAMSLARLGLHLVVLAGLLMFIGTAQAQEQQLQFDSITVYYHDKEQLNKFTNLVQPSALSQALSGIFGDSGGSERWSP